MSNETKNSSDKIGWKGMCAIIAAVSTVVAAVIGLLAFVYVLIDGSSESGMQHTSKEVGASTEVSNAKFAIVSDRLNDQEVSNEKLRDNLEDVRMDLKSDMQTLETNLRSDMSAFVDAIKEDRAAFAKEIREDRAALVKENRDDRAATSREFREIAATAYGTAASVNIHLAKHDSENSESCPCEDATETNFKISENEKK